MAQPAHLRWKCLKLTTTLIIGSQRKLQRNLGFINGRSMESVAMLSAQLKSLIMRRWDMSIVRVQLTEVIDADFAAKPCCHVAQMIVQVISTSEVAEVEDLDATVRGREDSSPPTSELRA
uniref:Uncharacterized protein n=1 Tax=Aegilops tauschii TaxID=37682 RepID=M8B5L0_AEGTA